MGEFAWNETGGLVTLHAVAIGRYVIGRRDLSSGRIPVVAGGAVRGDAGVIKSRPRKGGGLVTCGTVLRRPDGDMARMHARRAEAVVAGGTIINDTGMIEHRRRKGATGYMADSAILASDQMWWVDLGVLADGIDSVVAEAALPAHDIRA